jgi:hypothetical protein
VCLKLYVVLTSPHFLPFEFRNNIYSIQGMDEDGKGKNNNNNYIRVFLHLLDFPFIFNKLHGNKMFQPVHRDDFLNLTLIIQFLLHLQQQNIS